MSISCAPLETYAARRCGAGNATQHLGESNPTRHARVRKALEIVDADLQLLKKRGAPRQQHVELMIQTLAAFRRYLAALRGGALGLDLGSWNAVYCIQAAHRLRSEIRATTGGITGRPSLRACGPSNNGSLSPQSARPVRSSKGH